MPLEDLPGYLKNAKQHGQKDIPVVEMGRIIAPSINWPRRFSYAAIASLFLLSGGILVYNNLATKNVTIVINTDSPEAISDMIKEYGAQIHSLEKSDDNVYEVKLSTKRSIENLLKTLRLNKEFKKVEIEN